MRGFAVLLAAALNGCACTINPPATITVEPPMPPPQLVQRAAPAAGPSAPQQVLAAAEQARTDAAGYVAWTQSKPANIHRLTDLTHELDLAIARMRTHEISQRYPAADVSAAQIALAALRSFLANKDD